MFRTNQTTHCLSLDDTSFKDLGVYLRERQMSNIKVRSDVKCDMDVKYNVIFGIHIYPRLYVHTLSISNKHSLT